MRTIIILKKKKPVQHVIRFLDVQNVKPPLMRTIIILKKKKPVQHFIWFLDVQNGKPSLMRTIIILKEKKTCATFNLPPDLSKRYSLGALDYNLSSLAMQIRSSCIFPPLAGKTSKIWRAAVWGAILSRHHGGEIQGPMKHSVHQSTLSYWGV